MIDTPRPKRRWYQYTLRTLFVLMTVLAVALGWYVHRVRQQKRAMVPFTAGGCYCCRT